jgi:hypothetical protein
MSFLVNLAVAGMGVGRIAIGLAPFIAAGPASRLLGFPQSHDNATARLMARMFGVRDIGLGVLAFYAIKHPEAAKFIFLFNAAMDAGDLLAILAARKDVPTGAFRSALFAIAGGLGWVVMSLVA